MNRICLSLLALCASISFAGCCYRPYGVDPYRGVAYGGAWEPQCAGPLDPFGFWCWFGYMRDWGNPCCGNASPYGRYAGPQVPMGGTVYGTPGCSNCGTEPMMATPTFVPEGAPMMQEQQPMPGGGLKPVPDPMMKQQEKSSGTMTYVMPPSARTRHRPVQFVPAQQRGVYRAAQQPPYVRAY